MEGLDVIVSEVDDLVLAVSIEDLVLWDAGWQASSETDRKLLKVDR